MTNPSNEIAPGFVAQCVHATLCPGCPQIRDSYGEQLAKKSRWVEQAVQSFPELAQLQVSATWPAERVEHYRTRAKWVADASGALGLYARGTHELVDLPQCRVLHPLLAEVTAVLRGLLVGHAVEGVDLALVGEQVMLTLITQHGVSLEPLEALARRVHERVPAVASVAISRRQKAAVQLLGTQHEVVLGPSELRAHGAERVPYHYAAHGAFQQVHAGTASRIYARVLTRVAALAPEGTLRGLELYAGSGALSLALAARGAQVLAVESFAPACERLERAAREQGLSVQVRSGDAGAVARELAARGERFDVVLVNPPRRGLDLAVREAIARLAPEHLAYVSCNPQSLARDLAQLARAGLAAACLEPFDMMPLSDQVETLAWLSRAPLPLPEILWREGALFALACAPHEASSSPDSEVGLLARVRALPGCADAVPAFDLEPGTSGVCLFAQDPDALRGVRARLGGLRERYVVLAKGVVNKRGKVERALTAGTRAVTTSYERLEVRGGHSLVQADVALEDAQGEAAGSFQVRKHLALIRHPVLGDARFGERATNKHFEMRHGLDRVFLHRARLTFELDARTQAVEAPLSPDLVQVWQSLQTRISAGADRR